MSNKLEQTSADISRHYKMGTAVMLYVLPMMLGQTYDLGKEKPGLQIYPVSVAENAVTVQHYFTDSQYRMVENANQIKDFLDVSGKLSLKIKSGLVDISGEGRYLKDTSSKTMGMEILVKVHFETVTKTIPSSVKPNADWNLMSEKHLGTHYVRSLTYGGDLLASIRISASNKYDLMRIKGAVNGGVNAGQGSFEANVKGKLEMLKENAQDSSSMEINYYASVPISGVAYTIDGLLKLVDDFPNQVRKVNNGLGNPLQMELYPLSSLKEGYPAYFENRGLTDELNDLENQFDDLKTTRRELGIWLTSLPPSAPEKVQKKIETFMNKLNTIFGTYIQAIADLDVKQGASTKPIIDAFDAYKDGGYIMSQKYVRKLNSMQKEIYDEYPELKPRIGGCQYVHWGRSDCGSTETEVSVSGVATASEVTQKGGSGDFLCSRLDPDQVNPKDYFSNYPESDVQSDHLIVSPIRYRGDLEKYKSMTDKPIACARCRPIHRTAVLVKAASKSCPSEKWVKEYEGYLMAPGTHSNKGEYICVDVDMKEPPGDIKFGSSEKNHLQEVREVTASCGSLPCGPYSESKAIPCVVCTI